MAMNLKEARSCFNRKNTYLYRRVSSHLAQCPPPPPLQQACTGESVKYAQNCSEVGCLGTNHTTPIVQRSTAVIFHFSSKQLLPFAFEGHYIGRCWAWDSSFILYRHYHYSGLTLSCEIYTVRYIQSDKHALFVGAGPWDSV